MPMATLENPTDDSVLQQLTTFQRDYFDAINVDDAAQLERFSTSWSAFNELIRSTASKLSQSTLQAIHGFASLIETISSDLLDLDAHPSTSDLDKLLEQTLQAVADEDTQTVSSEPQNNSGPSYILPAAKWLYENVHAPYPSVEVRSSLAKQSGCPRKDVDNWFIDARRRIGWNDLRKRRFGNRRADILEASARFHDDAAAEPSELDFEFVTITQNARDMYQKFTESRLATQLDHAVMDMTPAIQQQIQADKHQRKLQMRRDRQATKAAAAYPSPERSPAPSQRSTRTLSPSPSLCDVSDHASEPHSRKRHFSSVDFDEGDADERTEKRSRSDFISTQSHCDGLPSPARTEVLVLSVDDPQPLPSCQLSLPFMPSKRKRRLSESDTGRAPKRPQTGAGALTRQIAVSDPLPLMEPSLDEWLQALMADNHPVEPLSQIEPDPSMPLEIAVANLPVDVTPTAAGVSAPAFMPLNSSNLNFPAFPLDLSPSAWPSSHEVPADPLIGPCPSDPIFALDANAVMFPGYNPAELPHDRMESQTFAELSSLSNFWTDHNVVQLPPSAPLFSPFNSSAATLGTSKLTPSEKEAKQREFMQVQAKYLALCAELASS
uniref:Homeodomain type 1 mating protein a1-1 n=1 Tax=Coprinopsis scobicola TaxID=71696 RepID=Q9C1N6_COPSC|nr:homeodomain type 1 mating protein a1-1 [Coprinopsis scobicola]